LSTGSPVRAYLERGNSSEGFSRKKKPSPLFRPSRPAATCSLRSGAALEARVAEPVVQDLHDRDARVEADQVGERERPHRVREAELRDRVDRLALGDALEQRMTPR
jgi:hypothetical protein